MAEVLLTLFLETLLELCAFSSSTFGLVGSDILALVIVDVPSDLEVKVCLSGGRCDALGPRVWLSWGNCAVGGGLVRLKAARSVCCDAEVAREWRTDV